MPVRPTPPRRRSSGGVARLLLLLLLVVGFGFVASRSEATPPPAAPDPAAADAARAIDALLDPSRSAQAVELLPADFEAVTKVQVGTQRALDGTVRAVHVGGGCSAPWGDDSTRWNFGTPCRSHDLGYDLLRYAEKKGSPLSAEVREALDERLTKDMYTTCEVNPRGTLELCRTVAGVYSAGLVVNSWHQRWGPPVGKPLLPLLSGVAVIGLLLWHRLRDRARSAATVEPDAVAPHRRRRRLGTVAPATPWTLLGVGSVAVLILGESAVALARWAGAPEHWVWPLTWPAQTAVVFFVAAGHVNAAAWSEITGSGGGIREYLAHRGSWLLRLTLVFAVVALAVPLALEVLHVPPATAEGVVRVALHPLWLLGLYLATVVLTPLLQTLHRRAPRATSLVLALGLATTVWLDTVTTLPWPDHLGALALALLAQQAALAYREGFRPSRRQLLLTAVGGLATLVLGVSTGNLPRAALGVEGAPPALAGPTTSALLVGLVHVAVLGLVAARLRSLVCRPNVLRLAGLASRVPMSLYLLYLTAVLLLVSAVYLPRRFWPELGAPGMPPRALLAIALLVGPAVVVFVWVERHIWHKPPPVPVWNHTQPGLGTVLSHGATVAGFGFAGLGLVGFALMSLGTENVRVDGVLLDPVQSLVHLLLGITLLHSVRSGTSNAPRTWLLAAMACVPPLLSVTTSPSPTPAGVLVHAAACALVALAAVATAARRLISSGRRGHA
ncbi:phospholipase A2 [Saccharomonospora sp. NB11]|jgi:hypothetical protein|uniref:phospholipase A2 n=1 Tax=Saccharomonospora sp. NB11 TaxID=1642298 RepID=UPI0018D03FF8|nr:phospholipase A2 [Saccharomonospora sp. NB11]